MNYIGGFEEALTKFGVDAAPKTKALVERHRAELKVAMATGNHRSGHELLEISKRHVQELFEHVIRMEIRLVDARNRERALVRERIDEARNA